MKKIPTVFERDWDGDRSRVTEQVHSGCEWVLAGEGHVTRKYDGTCVMVDDEGAWWARREVKPGKDAPHGFVAADHDEETGKTVGWEPIEQSAFARWHAEALDASWRLPKGRTYELIGPKVNGNPEATEAHELVCHEHADLIYGVERSFEGIRAALEELDVEGFVFHHDDGRMAKIKKRDFGLPRKPS